MRIRLRMASPQPQPPKPSKLRFGVFEIDLQSRELTKHGVRLKIQEQPFEILCVLLERPGEIVSREELRRRLWPDNTFVEYEDSLNTAVRKLRAVLSDSSDQPRYVETVARRGYRFIAPVVPVIPRSPSGDGSATPVAASGKQTTHRSTRRVWWLLAVLAVALAALLAMPARPMPRLVGIVPLTESGTLHSNQKLLTDGPRLYFTERTNGRWLQKWMPTSGGTAVSIPLPFPADLQDISPDDSELLVRQLLSDTADLWTVSTAGSGLHRLGMRGVVSAAYTRDGHSLLYSQGSDVFICDRDGDNSRRLITLPGDVYGISMSPAGDRLRFYVDQGPTTGVLLWESRSDGTDLHQVLSNWPRPSLEWGGSWNPDGRWFTFNARRGGRRDVWLLRGPGLLHRQPVLVRLTSGPMDFVYPIFSRDGKRIFVVGITQRGELTRYDFKKREFSPFLGGISAEDLAFSPDGKSLLFVSYPDGQLWRAQADGSGRVPLTIPPMMAGWAYWSPDGSRIAFEGKPGPDTPWNAYVVSAQGDIPQLVTEKTNHCGLSWRPDGKSLLIGTPDGKLGLRVVDLEHHSIVPLAGTEGMTEPYLSHNGRYAVVRTKDTTLALFDLVNHQVRQLAEGNQDIGYPRWSADDRYVYFNRFLGTAPAFYRVRVADGFSERIMDLTQFSATGSWGTWSTIAPDGSLLLLRDLGGADIYALDWSER